MKRSIELRMAVVAAVVLFTFAMSGLAQQSKPSPPRGVSNPVQAGSVRVPSTPGVLFIPSSSVAQPQQPNKLTAHTNVRIYVPSGQTPETLPPFPGYGYETPQSIACHYGLVSDGAAYPNCNPNNSALGTATGGGGAIAIVDAYDDPAADGDLAWFSLEFGIPISASQFQVVWANTIDSSCNYSGVPIDYTGGWEIEESLDIEWAHAMAPAAQLYLVEACSNYVSDLQQAVLVANNLVQCGNSEINPSTLVLGACPSVTGWGEVSMSWGGGEFASETGTTCTSVGIYENPANDGCFTAANVVYFGAAGDSPGVLYPCASPNVVCVGGTTDRRDPNTLNWIQETAWVDAGGGVSMFEPKPSYQAPIGNLSFTSYRGVPDISSDADPYTGVWVYDTFPIDGYYYYEWMIIGGTSASTPTWAGVVNNAAVVNGVHNTSSSAELTEIYNNRKVAGDFTDIPAGAGYCGFYMGTSTLQYYDLCTGVGVPNTYAGK